MADEKAAERKNRLVRALKQNLKRRKGQTGGAEDDAESAKPHGDAPSQGLGPNLGIAPQGGLEPLPPRRPKTASKRN